MTLILFRACLAQGILCQTLLEQNWPIWRRRSCAKRACAELKAFGTGALCQIILILFKACWAQGILCQTPLKQNWPVWHREACANGALITFGTGPVPN